MYSYTAEIVPARSNKMAKRGETLSHSFVYPVFTGPCYDLRIQSEDLSPVRALLLSRHRWGVLGEEDSNAGHELVRGRSEDQTAKPVDEVHVCLRLGKEKGGRRLNQSQ